MTDNLTHAWRATPLEDIMPTSRLLDDLERAGYETAGDVLDAEPDELAADVYGIGPMRAVWLRQKVFDYVKPFGSQGEPQWVLVDPKHEIEETTPSAADAIATICSIVAVGLMVYLFVWLVL